MAGSLFHDIDFREERYLGRDEHEHWEVVPVRGEIEVVSISSWREVRGFLLRSGVPEPLIPEFDDNIDLPVEDIRSRNAAIGPLIRGISTTPTGYDYWLSRVVAWVRAGEMFFFTP